MNLVPPVWFCVASGPSLVKEDVDAIFGLGTVVAINNVGFEFAPWADVLYSCDAAWWAHYADKLRYFEGWRVTIDEALRGHRGMRVVAQEDGEGLGRNAIRTGCNSGYQAINLAYLHGAKTIVLLGYDMQHGPNGERHFHGDHPAPLGNFTHGMPELCASKFPALANDLSDAGVRVLNCSRQTALSCFERVPLSTVLAQLDPALPVATRLARV